jgi:predicted phosphodiesterase
MLLLCVSDIHGHLDKLRAVLAAAERRAFHKLLVAGDLLFPGPEPLETWRRLSAAGAILVQGLSDRAISTLDPKDIRATTEHEQQMLERMKEVRGTLGELILERVRRLPAMHRMPLEDGRELLLVHGSPADPSEPMSFDMSDEEINALVGDDPADVIVCGGSHVPFDRALEDVRVINVGSVGEAPGGGYAHATWIESTAAGIQVEQVHIPLG